MDWSDRTARIHRLREKAHFDHVVMPLAYTAAGLGFLVLGWQGVEILEKNPTQAAFWVPALFFFLLPIPLKIFRWLRSHHSSRLKA